MKQPSAIQLAHKLFSRVQAIKLGEAAGVFGTTQKQSMLQELQKRSAELGAALAQTEPYDKVMTRYEALIASVDTAGLAGIISEAELADYYKLTDSIWAAIERESGSKL